MKAAETLKKTKRYKKKVLLITPPYHCGVVESAGRWPNLGFIYIAGQLRKAGFEVEIYDAMSRYDGWPEIEIKLSRASADFVGSTAYTATINDAVKALGLAKKINPGTVTFLGGVHPTFCYEEVLLNNTQEVDFCVLGEGELTAPELLQAVASGADLNSVAGIAFREAGRVRRTPQREFIKDLDRLQPAWDLVNWPEYPLYFIDDSCVATVSSSRGCIHECSFCSQYKFWRGSWRGRDAVKFTDELEMLHRDFGVNVFFIVDEYPTRSRQRWERILDILIAKDMPVYLLLETCVDDIIRDEDILDKYRKAGVLFIYMGVEATDQKRLNDFGKDIQVGRSKQAIDLINQADIISESSLILGMPDETEQSISRTLRLAKYYDSDFMHFLAITPWPYADIYEKLKPYIEVWDYSRYNLIEPIIRPEQMSRKELFKQMLGCYRSYYMGKLPAWAGMEKNSLKRSCLLKGMKAIMENSFLKEHMSGLGKMPEQVKKYLALYSAA